MSGRLMSLHSTRTRPVGAPVGPGIPTGTIVDPTIGVTWRYLTSNAFPTAVSLGGFDTMRTGSDQGKLDPATPGGTAYASAWKAKSEGSADTAGFAVHSAKRTMSVIPLAGATGSPNVLDVWDHIDPATGQACGSAIKPLLPTGQPGVIDENFMQYCRVEIRLRSTGVTGTGWGLVALLIHSGAGTWPEYGEHDWPEVQLAGPVGGNYHFAQATNAFTHVDGGGRVMTDWHTYVIEWFPWAGGARYRWWVDDFIAKDSVDRVAVAPPANHGWLIQSGSNGNPVPAGVEGHWQLDYYVIHTAA